MELDNLGNKREKEDIGKTEAEDDDVIEPTEDMAEKTSEEEEGHELQPLSNESGPAETKDKLESETIEDNALSIGHPEEGMQKAHAHTTLSPSLTFSS